MQLIFEGAPVTPEMADLLARLRDWPDVGLEQLRQRPEWDELSVGAGSCGQEN